MRKVPHHVLDTSFINTVNKVYIEHVGTTHPRAQRRLKAELRRYQSSKFLKTLYGIATSPAFLQLSIWFELLRFFAFFVFVKADLTLSHHKHIVNVRIYNYICLYNNVCILHYTYKVILRILCTNIYVVLKTIKIFANHTLARTNDDSYHVCGLVSSSGVIALRLHYAP